ncbi:hypothetical protein Q7C36_011590 [Tachysurus vachellii]|uniref:Uncharacterized protein n=1 Tax=Tachysurus vachellii TaxID=175792 RepID=A0AA88SLG1_TACVA|nr:hypothetical protein Q7C36_011590 [Tachysurus vachellii]
MVLAVELMGPSSIKQQHNGLHHSGAHRVMVQHHAPQQGKTSGRWVQCSATTPSPLYSIFHSVSFPPVLDLSRHSGFDQSLLGKSLEGQAGQTGSHHSGRKSSNPPSFPPDPPSSSRPDWPCPLLSPSFSQPPMDQLEPCKVCLPTNGSDPNGRKKAFPNLSAPPQQPLQCE